MLIPSDKTGCCFNLASNEPTIRYIDLYFIYLVLYLQNVSILWCWRSSCNLSTENQIQNEYYMKCVAFSRFYFAEENWVHQKHTRINCIDVSDFTTSLHIYLDKKKSTKVQNWISNSQPIKVQARQSRAESN